MINQNQIKLIQSYRDKSYILSLLCIENSNFYSLIKNIFNIPLILSNTIMLILNSYDKINQDNLQISNIVLNACTALLLSLNNNFKINEKITNFKTIGLKLNKYCSNLEDILSNDINELNHDDIKKLIDEYNNLNEMIEYSFLNHIKNKIKSKYDGKKVLPNELNMVGSFIILENNNVV